jgi:aminoglycoside phosphotransferase (APT) family kinase protein
VEDGYDFAVALVDGEWAFRFPRWDRPARMLEIEAALLPALGPALPVAVPRFEHVAREPEPFVAYRLIDGTPLQDEDPQGIAAFLTALHAFDAAGTPVDCPDTRSAFAEQCERFRETVAPLLEPGERGRAESLFAEAESLQGFEPALLHADLGPAHLLCRNGRLVGVIDWSDTRIGDPALDFGWLLHRHPRGEEILAAYGGPVDDGFRTRALFYHRLAPWFEADYGVFTKQLGHVTAGLAGIRERLP